MIFNDTLVSDMTNTKPLFIKFDVTKGLFYVHFNVSMTEPKPFASFQEAKDWVSLYGTLYTEGLHQPTSYSL